MTREMRNLFSTTVTSMLLVVLALTVEAFDESLLMYLPLDSLTGKVARDLTGKTKGGNIVGGTKIVPGKRGRALQLDGESGYVEIDLTPEMVEAERNSFTAELWLQTQAKGPGVPEQIVRAFNGYLIFGGHGPGGHSQGHWSMFFFSDVEAKDRFRFFVVNSFTPTSNGTPGIIADKPKINDGEWHHLVAVRDEDNKELRAYIDGQLVGAVDDFTRSLNSKPDNANRRKKIWLGIHEPNDDGKEGTGYFPAAIDEVRFWGGAMNEADAVRIMSLAVDPSEKLSLTWGEVKARHTESY